MNKSVKLDILMNINLRIKGNEYIAIMGTSGSEKSTFTGILSCTDRQTSGYLRINNTEVTYLNKEDLTKFRNKNIGTINEQIRDIFYSL